jgi:hypothetical protein
MDLSNYVDVPTRFAALLEKWPELRIKEHRPEIVTIGDKIFISVTMQAWRTPDDPLPCQATCLRALSGANIRSRATAEQDERFHELSRTLGRAHDVVPKDGLTGGSDQPTEGRETEVVCVR